ncbi:hypothetical protein E4U28_003191 [Claviceps purpurea]|nr:hypothetical protein E4U28_003191 [Claviceps purpurea]
MWKMRGRQCYTANAQWDQAGEAYLNRPTHFASPAGTEESTDRGRRHESEAMPSQEIAPGKKVGRIGRPLESRNRVQSERTRKATRLTGAINEPV